MSPASKTDRLVAPTRADRAAINPFAALSGLLRRPMASYYLLLASSGLLLAIGLVMVLSASSVVSYAKGGSSFTIFAKQALWAAIGLPAFWLGLRLRPRAYELLGYPLLLASAGMLALLGFVPSLGYNSGGAVLWLKLGPIQMQPAESAKLGLALWGAATLVHKRALLGEWKHMAVPLLPVAALVLALVGRNDLGSMLLLLIVLLTLLWVSGVRFRFFGAMFAVGIVGVLWLVNRKQYRMERFTSFFHPFADMHGVTQQAGHSLWALAGGGWWGRGLGNSQEKWHYLPLSYNDFIFAIIGEELGVVGCFVVIGLFAVLLYAGLRIATRVEDPFRRLVAASCTLWLVGQALINMGAVANLLPITGVPLPLISAGGSSLVITMFMIGMLGSFARAEPDAAVALHARGRTWWARMWGIPLPPLPKGRAVARPPRQRATAGRRRVGQLAEEEVSR